MSQGNVNERLERAVAERPQAMHLLDLKVVGRAVGVAALLTIVSLILFSSTLAAIVLVLSFFATWIFLGMRSYEERRPTTPVSSSGSG
jgi:hypothetical protein